MEFSEKVKTVRKIMGLSQEKLAQLLNVSFSTVNRWEQGKSLPSYTATQKFEELCKERCIKFDE
jgi:transcriptional regulator with XRE-family HTH domain